MTHVSGSVQSTQNTFEASMQYKHPAGHRWHVALQPRNPQQFGYLTSVQVVQFDASSAGQVARV